MGIFHLPASIMAAAAEAINLSKEHIAEFDIVVYRISKNNMIYSKAAIKF